MDQGSPFGESATKQNAAYVVRGVRLFIQPKPDLTQREHCECNIPNHIIIAHSCLTSGAPRDRVAACPYQYDSTWYDVSVENRAKICWTPLSSNQHLDLEPSASVNEVLAFPDK